MTEKFEDLCRNITSLANLSDDPAVLFQPVSSEQCAGDTAEKSTFSSTPY